MGKKSKKSDITPSRLCELINSIDTDVPWDDWSRPSTREEAVGIVQELRAKRLKETDPKTIELNRLLAAMKAVNPDPVYEPQPMSMMINVPCDYDPSIHDIIGWERADVTWEGNIDISHSRILELPMGLFVRGNVDASYSSLVSLPTIFTICGNLDLRYSNVTELSYNHLSVSGKLDIRHTKITSVSDRVKVGLLIVGKDQLDDVTLQYHKCKGTRIQILDT